MADLASLLQQFYDRVTGTPEMAAGASSDGLVASGNLEVYAEMYTSRLLDTVAEDYPKLHTALGHELFFEVVTGYLRAHPPHSFTLRECGSCLPAYLRGRDRVPAWAADLAALERARIEVFDGPDAAPLTQADAVALDARLPELVVRWVPSHVVVPIGWAVDDVWSAIEDDQPPFAPAEVTRTVLVWRRDVTVLHRTLDDDEAELAPTIAIGTRFAEICEVLGSVHGDDASGRAAELLLRWIASEALVTSDPPVDPLVSL